MTTDPEQRTRERIRIEPAAGSVVAPTAQTAAISLPAAHIARLQRADAGPAALAVSFGQSPGSAFQITSSPDVQAASTPSHSSSSGSSSMSAHAGYPSRRGVR